LRHAHNIYKQVIQVGGSLTGHLQSPFISLAGLVGQAELTPPQTLLVIVAAYHSRLKWRKY